MNIEDLNATVQRVIREIAAHAGKELPGLDDDTELVDDLGFTSMQIAALIANLEDALGFDPFLDENVSVTDIRTLADLRKAYADGLGTQA